MIRITIPGAREGASERGPDLIQDFLWYTEGLADAQVAELAGVSTATIQRWRRSGSHRLRQDIRQRLHRYVVRQQQASGPATQAA